MNRKNVSDIRVLIVGKDNVMKWPQTVYEFMPVKNRSLFVYNKSGFFSAFLRLFGKRTRNAYAARLLKKRVDSFKPDVVLLVGAFLLPTELFDALKSYPQVVKAAWAGDNWIWKDKNEIAAKTAALDVLFVTATDFFDEARACGFSGKVFYAPLCANEKIFKKDDTPRTGKPFFVGVANEDRHKMFEACEVPCLIYGKGWDADRLKRHEVHNKRLSLAQAQAFIKTSVAPININMTANSKNNLNFRTFEISACGGLIITNPRADLALNYDVGTQAVVYETPEGFNELIKDIVSHREKYSEIARRGYERTMARHTYAKRLEAMLLDLLNASAD